MSISPLDKTCTLVFLRKNDQILLAMKKRGFGANLWNGVGGKIEPGETTEQALVRETQEEINVTPLTWEKVAVHDFVMDVDTSEPWHMYVQAYLCYEWKGEPAESEEMAPQWFNIRDIPYDQMWDDDSVWIPQVLRGRKLQCLFNFTKENAMISAKLLIVDKI